MLFFFVFKQKTAYEMRISDWSSDVCSSDLQFTLPALRSAGIAATEDNGMLVFSGLSEQARRHAARIWAMRRVQGKLLSVLRLVKASATFSGGIEYLAWKISRHSGAPLELRPWQRRFPRSEEHTSELQSLMRISYALFCL